jgi:allantoicase
MLEYADAGASFDARTARWKVLVPEAPLEAHQQHRWDNLSPKVATHVRLNIYPDGGVARLRLYGSVAG